MCFHTSKTKADPGLNRVAGRSCLSQSRTVKRLWGQIVFERPQMGVEQALISISRCPPKVDVRKTLVVEVVDGGSVTAPAMAKFMQI